jgi:hypothetical protein
MMTDDFLTAQEAADILGYSPSWITWLCRSRVLKAEIGEGRGSPWKISRESVEEFASEDEEDVELDVLEEYLEDIEADGSDTQEGMLQIAFKYGPGVVKILIGLAGSVFPPVIVIYEGVQDIINAKRK